MSKDAKWVSKYYFLEVGLKIGDFEGYLMFAVPYSLKMKRYNPGSGYVFIDLQDWLCLDFPTILCNKVNGGDPTRFKVICVSKVLLDTKNPVPIYSASCSIDSWCDPFIHLFACTFINLSLYGK